MLAPLSLAQVLNDGWAAKPGRERGERGLREHMGRGQDDPSLSVRVRYGLDTGIERAQRDAVLLEPPFVERDGVGQRTVAHAGEAVQRNVPQIRNLRLELFPLAGHREPPV